jgi:hypothetical protein
LIPAPPGLVARYKHQGVKTTWTHRRVIAFDEDWQPLVISDDHRLEYAGRYGNYDGIEDLADPDVGDLAAIMPAGGWRIEYANEDGSKWAEPLVGWALRNGTVIPLVVDGDGLVDDLDMYSGEYRIYHPDQVSTAGSPEEAPDEA